MNSVFTTLLLLLMTTTNLYSHKPIESENKALLIIDIQNDYFEGGTNPLHNSEEASMKAKLLLEDFRLKKQPIIHIQHIATRSDATFFLPDSEGAEIHQNVKPISEEVVFIKHYPNSFRETELLEYLREEKITELVVVGMMTHMCIDATVRASKDYGFECTVISDACATKSLKINRNEIDANDVHNSILASLTYFYAKVMDTETYLEQQSHEF